MTQTISTQYTTIREKRKDVIRTVNVSVTTSIFFPDFFNIFFYIILNVCFTDERSDTKLDGWFGGGCGKLF